MPTGLDNHVLTTALEAASNAVIITDSVGIILWTNPAFARLTGYSSSEARGRTPQLLKSGAHDALFYQKLWSTILSGKPWSGEVVNRRKNGTFYAACQTITPVRNRSNEITHFIAFACDNTEHEHVYDALKRSEERFLGLAKAASDWIWEVDERGTYQYVSPRVQEILGYRPEELLGTTLFELMPDAEAQRVRELFARWSALKLPLVDVESVNLHRNGNPILIKTGAVPFCDDRGALLGYLGIHRDITSRRQEEAALRESEGRLRAAQRIARLGSWELDLRTGALTWSDEVRRIFRVPTESFEPTYDAFLALVHPEDRETIHVATRRAALERAPCRIDHRIIWPTGEQRYVRQYAEVVLDAGEPVRMLGAVQDITEERNVKEQLRRAQRMEALGTLAVGVVHDFNNLLTVIHGYTDLVLNNLEEESPLRSAVGEIRTAGIRAAALTRQILSFSRRGASVWGHVNINETIAEMGKMLRRLIGSHIELRTRLDPALGTTRADRNHLEQVIMNLAVNACDAMPQGGILTIETRNVDLDAEYAALHEDVQPGPHIAVSVSDTGTGMSQGVMKHLFEPFFTTKPEGKGTGLGLSIVDGIVQECHGHIRLCSELGHGTTICIYLPRSIEMADTSMVPIENGRPSCGRETILVVEDDEQVRKLACLILGAQGYTVLEAATGPEALQLAARTSGLALVLTEFILPGMGGTELAQQLKAENPNVKLLFMSGYSDEAVTQHTRTTTGTGFVQKPFTPETLGTRIREVLDPMVET